ncbi:hypothetical protein K458DRAFT_382490 [Lentithecium fluviatile CBS 122367]|uniref:Uncharacterized protein n=1 Tax=Lentithecium fluviatile CBS 122367 TaxID=1168545 RepID=A0A6G1JKZ9_9PLEO|nr:hypothetical protein K458DRAFT_382490 [Lentithecium fluviatile CBS 122367]
MPRADLWAYLKLPGNQAPMVWCEATSRGNAQTVDWLATNKAVRAETIDFEDMFDSVSDDADFKAVLKKVCEQADESLDEESSSPVAEIRTAGRKKNTSMAAGMLPDWEQGFSPSRHRVTGNFSPRNAQVVRKTGTQSASVPSLRSNKRVHATSSHSRAQRHTAQLLDCADEETDSDPRELPTASRASKRRRVNDNRPSPESQEDQPYAIPSDGWPLDSHHGGQPQQSRYARLQRRPARTIEGQRDVITMDSLMQDMVQDGVERIVRPDLSEVLSTVHHSMGTMHNTMSAIHSNMGAMNTLLEIIDGNTRARLLGARGSAPPLIAPN